MNSNLSDLEEKNIIIITEWIHSSGSKTIENIPKGTYLLFLQGYDSYSAGLKYIQIFENNKSYIYNLRIPEHWSANINDRTLTLSNDSYSQGCFVLKRIN